MLPEDAHLNPKPAASANTELANESFSNLGAALRNAARSQESMKLMKEQGIKGDFSPISDEGVCKVDVTCNETGAYKVRGALVSGNAAQREGKTMLVTASAGNHGAGIAYAARQLKMNALVYVPEQAPEIKVRKIQSFGATVVRRGANFDECYKAAEKESQQRDGGAAFIHPFDSHDVVAGQGTIGFELLEFVKKLPKGSWDKVRVVVPIGGGGLAAGVLSVLKTQWSDDLPPFEVIGVVDEDAPAPLLAMLRGRQVQVVAETIADGTKVERVGERFLEVAHLLDGLVLLPHDALVRAMREHAAATGVQLEGAGALALGGDRVLRDHQAFSSDERVLSLVLLTGSNIDEERFTAELNKAERMDTAVVGRQGYNVEVSETSGELLHFLEEVAAFNIVSLTYVKKVGSSIAHLRVEFEVEHSLKAGLTQHIGDTFPGSYELRSGEQMVYVDGIQQTEAGTEGLVRLTDQPGSFLEWVQDQTNKGALGSVDFLFYRKPATPKTYAQVVVGQASSDQSTVAGPHEGQGTVLH